MTVFWSCDPDRDALQRLQLLPGPGDVLQNIKDFQSCCSKLGILFGCCRLSDDAVVHEVAGPEDPGGKGLV